MEEIGNSLENLNINPKEIPQKESEDLIEEELIKKIIKHCPICTILTYKIDGCNYLKCICGTEWCWLCESQKVISCNDKTHNSH